MRCLSLLPLLLLPACGSEPTYPPPTNAEAKAAYVRAIRADLIEAPPKYTVEGPANLEAGDSPNEAGRKVGSVLLAESERSARLEARKSIASLTKVTVGECTWGSIEPDDIKPHGRDRVEGKVEDGYSCAYEVFHNTDTRGPVSASGTGFFFHRDGSYDFAGSEEGSFAPVRGNTTAR
jgi:hypothetical protein